MHAIVGFAVCEGEDAAGFARDDRAGAGADRKTPAAMAAKTSPVTTTIDSE